MIRPKDYSQPDMWLAYADVMPAARAHFVDRAPLSDLAAAIETQSVHGVAVGTALVLCALDDMAATLGMPLRSAIAMLDGVEGWRDKTGVEIQSILATWIAGPQMQALGWAEGAQEDGRAARMAHGLADRLHFAIHVAALRSGQAVPDRYLAFARRFEQSA